jgi:NTP pyrophosphatase (non-canonical NTP hydrolase)
MSQKERKPADCLWSVCVLAELYQIDLEQAFLDTMVELEQTITAEIAPMPPLS